MKWSHAQDLANTQPQFSIRLKLLLKISFELIRVYLDTHDGDDIGGMCTCFFSIVPRFSQTADIPVTVIQRE